MEIFEAEISRDESGRLTFMELPFRAREVFSRPKGTILVKGTINGVGYRGKLLARGGGRFVMVLDKAVQKAVGFKGEAMTVHVTMDSENSGAPGEEVREPVLAACAVDVMTAIKNRQSIRRFTSRPVSDEQLNAVLYAGLCAPTANNKRPCHFVVIKDRRRLSVLARNNPNAAMLESAACAVVVCGDKNVEGMKEFLYADCSAAAQNMLLCVHGLGLGSVWCGVADRSDWRKLLIAELGLLPKVEPVAVIAIGWPDETKELRPRWDMEKIHYNMW